MILIPYHVDVPMERWPIANWAVILFTIALSFDAFSGVQLETEPQRWMLQGSGDWWSDAGLLGSIFTHGDILHLLGNMVFLFVFGNAINAKLGHALFLASYILLGLVSGMLYAVASEDGTPALGASGAISGITGMFIVLYPRNNVSMFFGTILLMRPIVKTFQVSAWFVIGAYFLKDLIFQVLLNAGIADSGVALMAHLGGSGAGFVLAFVLLLTLRVVPNEYENTLVDIARERSASSRNTGRGSTPDTKKPVTPR